jgi:hypothetical protein
MKFLLLLVVMAIPSAAEWERRVITPKGERMDTPKPHPLSYFTRYPWLRDEDDELCFPCPPEKKLAAAKQKKARGDVRLVGRIHDFTIYDVLYFFDENAAPDWKSILVSKEPDKYHEIWHYQRNEGGVWPSFLVNVGQDTLLGLEDDCYRQEVLQEYFWFSEDGPVRVDFSPVWRAAKSVAPKGSKVWVGYDGRIDLPAGRMRVGLIRDPDWRCCSTGVVEVKFELKAGQFRIQGQRFLPTVEFRWGRGCR